MLLRLSRTITILWASMWERSEEHTSELQSWLHLVCRLLLEKKKHAAVIALEEEVQEVAPGSTWFAARQAAARVSNASEPANAMGLCMRTDALRDHRPV